MPNFRYSARDAGGTPQRGVAEAPSAEALTAELRGRGWLVLKVEPAGNAATGKGVAAIDLRGWLPIRSFDVELGLRQLSSMIRSGLTLLSALRTVAEQSRHRARGLWLDIADRIERGSTFSAALAAHPRNFTEYITQLVHVGEDSGELEQLLERGAEHLESNRNLRGIMLNAMVYPVLVTIMAIGVTAFMLLGVIPKIETFLADSGQQLPPLTRTLLDLSNWFRENLPAVGIGIVTFFAALFLISRWPPGKFFLHGIVLRIPVVGGIMRLAETAVFARGMGILLESGLPLIESLHSVEGLVRNRVVEARVSQARDAVTQGETLANALGAGNEFLPMLSRMVAVGESTGMLGHTLGDVATFHENQLVSTVRRLSVIIEPALIIVVGGIVAFVYIAFFMALFSLAGGAN